MRCVVWLALVCLPLASLTVQAQEPVGELFFDAAGGTQGQTSASYAIRTADELPTAGKAYLPASSMGGTYPTTFAFTVPYEFTAGVLDFHFALGCDTAGVAAPSAATAPMRIDVRDGSTLLEQINPTVAQTCVQQRLPITGSVDLDGHVFGAGSTMNVAVYAWFSNPYASGAGMYYVTGPTAAISGVGLPTGLIPPVTAAAALDAVYHDASNATLSFLNATSGTFVYNFTTEAGHGVLDAAVNGTGIVNATLVDGNGTALLNGTLATEMLEFRNVTAGAWRLGLLLQNFTGDISFAYLDGALRVPDSVAPQEFTPGEMDAVQAIDDDQESPGLPLAWVAAALAAVAVRKRLV